MSKYNVGDFVVAPGHVYKKIVGVIEGANPVYANITPYNSPKDDDRRGGYAAVGTRLTWDTEYELSQDKYAIHTPDFEAYSKLEAGDLLLVGEEGDADYIKVLARLGEAVLLSNIPVSKKQMEVVSGLTDQLKELTEGKVDMSEIAADEMAEMKKQSSMTHAHKVANIWKTIEWVCLMNWTIVGE